MSHTRVQKSFCCCFQRSGKSVSCAAEIVVHTGSLSCRSCEWPSQPSLLGCRSLLVKSATVQCSCFTPLCRPHNAVLCAPDLLGQRDTQGVKTTKLGLICLSNLTPIEGLFMIIINEEEFYRFSFSCTTFFYTKSSRVFTLQILLPLQFPFILKVQTANKPFESHNIFCWFWRLSTPG